MQKRKITVTSGARADYGFLRPVLKEILTRKILDLYLIVSGMHLSKRHGFTINEIKKDGFKINAIADTFPKKDTVYHTSLALGKGIVEFSKIFQKIKPDINVVLGDRDEMLASAIAAAHMNIPNAHIHGGDKSGSIDESNRHAITKFSHIHFAVSKNSMKRIIKMGENPKNVFFTGSPGIDEIINKKITSKVSLEKKYNFKFSGNEILLIQHPVTTQNKQVEAQICNTLNALEKIKKNIIAIAPNSDAGHRIIFQELKKFSNRNQIKIYPNLPRKDYLSMLENCNVLIGNSSSGIIEASYFDIPVIDIGIRQKDRERAQNVFNVKSEPLEIYKTIVKVMKLRNKKFKKSYIYGDGSASKKIVHRLETIRLTESLLEKELTY